jgi:hypothetical protein
MFINFSSKHKVQTQQIKLEKQLAVDPCYVAWSFFFFYDVQVLQTYFFKKIFAIRVIKLFYFNETIKK